MTAYNYRSIQSGDQLITDANTGAVVGIRSAQAVAEGIFQDAFPAGPVSATTLSASGAVSGAGFTAYMASPPEIGGTTPGVATFSALTGVSTNSSAAAGKIGEEKIATLAVGSAVSETTATPVSVLSLSLTAGDWDVSGVVNRDLAGVTATRYTAAISPTANTVPAQAGGGGVGPDSAVGQFATFGTTITGAYTTAVGPVRVSLAATTTIYLVAADVFSAGTVGLFGTIRARRVR